MCNDMNGDVDTCVDRQYICACIGCISFHRMSVEEWKILSGAQHQRAYGWCFSMVISTDDGHCTEKWPEKVSSKGSSTPSSSRHL